MEQLIQKFFNWEIAVQAAPFLLQGALVTIKVTVLAEVLSLLVGLLCALVRVSNLGVLKIPVIFYVDLFRVRRCWSRSSSSSTRCPTSALPWGATRRLSSR